MTDLKLKFSKLFHASATYESFAPGRVNLIGEHTDYTGGLVFPVALNIGTYALARKRKDQKLRLYSLNFEELGIIEVDLGDLKYKAEHNWANYPKGVLYELSQLGKSFDWGLDILFYGNIPNGAGLSSSASIELAMAALVNEVYAFQLDAIELVKISKKTENDYIGVNCGIMDQFIIGMGKKDHALLLDTHKLNYENVPLDLGDFQLVIVNSMIKRTLSDSKYNQRIEEAKKADVILKNSGIHSIASLCIEDLKKVEEILKDDALYKKIKHIVTENHRTKEAAIYLKEKNLLGFGKLMLESHDSLKNDFQVSIRGLDELVESAMENGAIGARMTGAGFGGCMVTLVHRSKLEEMQKNMKKNYSEMMGMVPEFYVVSSGSGARASLLLEV